MSKDTWPNSRVARLLRAILDPLPVGAAIVESALVNELMNSFEYDLPPLLDKQGFNDGSDGMLMAGGRKEGPQAAQFVGTCILMESQRTTPFHVRLQIESAADEVTWLEFRLGERDGERMKTAPYDSPWKWRHEKLIATLDDVNAINWYYAAGIGDKPLEWP